jgi:site-specific DNA-cytosine methylase
MRVLVGCEFSGVVRDAFTAAGHDAMSCDLIDTESPFGYHFVGDIKQCLYEHGMFDLIILHPPCTYMAVSGNRWYGKGQPHHDKRIEAIDWTLGLWELAKKHSPRVVLENPVSALSGAWRRPDQYFQPYEFGVKECKKTGLWLHGVDPLEPENALEPPARGSLEHREWQRIWYMSPSEDRGKERSRFYPEVAAAMARQWG